jgi:cytidylate kinase
MSNLPSIIAIDGPAASGKSTLGLKLAQALGYLFFDTGVMYRAVTWLVLDRGVDVSDETSVTTLAESTPIEVAPASELDGRTSDVIVDGRDITWETRLPEVERNVSAVSAYRGVRAALSQQQRRIGLRGGVVKIHGSAKRTALKNAMLQCARIVNQHLNDELVRGIGCFQRVNILP